MDFQYRKYFDLVSPKLIDWEFYEPYTKHKPPFGQLGLVVYLRTHSRFIPELGRREKFCESILRTVEYNVGLDKVSNYDELKLEATQLFAKLFNLEGFTSSRSLWIAGTKQTEIDGSANWNCTATEIDTISAFSEVYYWLLLGAGTGLGLQKESVSKLPYFQTNKTIQHKDYAFNGSKYPNTRLYSEHEEQLFTKEDLIQDDNNYLKYLNYRYSSSFTIEVGDSKEGWCNAVRIFLELCTLELASTITFDYNNIRPEGERIKTFGGRSSGYKGIKNTIDRTYKILQRCNGKIEPIDALDILNGIGVDVASGGVRRCLPKGTLVHLKNGLVKIEDVKVGELVKTSKGYYEVTDWVYQGVQDITQVETQLGVFECTDKHKIAVLSSTRGDYIWKQARELEPGDRMVFVRETNPGMNTNLPSFEYQKPAHSTTCKDISIPEMSVDIAYLLGFLHGNGYIRLTEKSGEISLSVAPDLELVVHKLVKILKLFKVNVNIDQPKPKNNCFIVRLKSKQLALFLSQFKQAGESLVIPNVISQGLIEYRWAYAAGIFDSDGCFKKRPITLCYSVYPDYLKQLQCLYASLGIASAIRQHRSAFGKWQALFTLNLKGEVFVKEVSEKITAYSYRFGLIKERRKSKFDFGFPKEFILNEKIKYGEAWSKQSTQMTVATYERVTGEQVKLVPVEVLDVTHAVRLDETYDISVAGVNEFVADAGYLVHNTAQIGLGDIEDTDFVNAKLDLYTDESKAEYRKTRSMSNNSVLLYENPGLEKIQGIMERIKSNGEPGFWIVGNAQKFNRCIKFTNPCGEAGLDNKQSCNLTTLNLVNHLYYDNDLRMWFLDWEKLKETIQLVTRVGSRQTLATQWHPEWDSIQKRDRLLGVSMTGVVDAFDTLKWRDVDEIFFWQWAKKIVRVAADRYHEHLGIPRSARVSLLKPEGTLSKIPTVSSGIHRSYSPYQFRRIRFSKNDPLAKVIQTLGLVPVPENGQGEDIDSSDCNTWIFTFPLKNKTNTRAIDESAIAQLERYRRAQKYYADSGHNVSVTVTLAPDEYDVAAKWVYENYDDIIGISFLPRFDPREGGVAAYPNMPEEPCEEWEYLELKAKTPELKEEELIALISLYEKEESEYELENDCSSGGCPIR